MVGKWSLSGLHLLFCVLLISAVAAGIALAETPEESGLEIAREAERLDTGWGDCTMELVMILINPDGREMERKMRLQSFERADDGDMTLFVIEEPLDVKGVALLTHSHNDQANDQWLYLPALKRVKRIAGNSRSGTFMASEFSYEDLEPPEIEHYSYRLLREETYGDQDCYVLERTPVEQDSGYSRMIVWMDKAYYRIQKVDYYDRADRLLKTLVALDYDKHLDRFWRAKTFEMQNVQTGAATKLIRSNIVFQSGLTERDFDKNSLARVR